MPRPRRGLGQGLGALVPEPPPDVVFEPPRDPGEATEEPVPTDRVRWEYACLERPRKNRGKRRRYARIWFSAAGSEAILEPRRTVLAARSPWAALGLMGAEGWELVGMDKRALYFKRPAR